MRTALKASGVVGVSPRWSDRCAIVQLSSVQCSWQDEVADAGVICCARSELNGCCRVLVTGTREARADQVGHGRRVGEQFAHPGDDVLRADRDDETEFAERPADGIQARRARGLPR